MVEAEEVEEAAVLEELDEAVVLDVPDVAVVDDVLPIPSADNAASSADNSGFESVELVDEVDEDVVVSQPPPVERRVAPTESRFVAVCEPLTLCMLMMLDLLTG
ncbi:hypothetical protein [Paraburkholderia haematera]|uniref:hypothetical protein n=1 Tax=Paraburkholderia haematera TaxID=2793077 RepID=UPI001B8C5CC8|nr:hypothetical protein [Paraburkholderia haematera]